MTTEDWVPIDGKMHLIVRVPHPNGPPDIYVDGELVPIPPDRIVGGMLLWDHALSRAQAERHYREATGIAAIEGETT